MGRKKVKIEIGGIREEEGKEGEESIDSKWENKNR